MEEIVLEPGQVIKVRCGACSGNNMSNVSNSGSTVNLSLASNSNNEGAATGGKRSRKGMKTRKAQEGGKKKRGPNGYMKFAAEQRPRILKENPDMRSNVVAVARKIGEAWRALPESERKKY